MRSRRLFPLALALQVAAASVGPCTGAALAGSGVAAPVQTTRAEQADPAHAGHAEHAQAGSTAQGQPACHGPVASIGAPCPCGCSGEGHRAAAGAGSAPWALAAPLPARFAAADAPAPPGRDARLADPPPSHIDHVPIGA